MAAKGKAAEQRELVGHWHGRAQRPQDTDFCKAHGGGRRCQHKGCPKAAQSGGTPHCMAHGGGKRCQKEHCFQLVARGAGNVYCGPCLQATQANDTQ